MGELLKPAARCTQAKPELGDFLLVQNTEPSNGTVAGVGWSERGHLMAEDGEANDIGTVCMNKLHAYHQSY
jgi:hypothetical protein